MTAAAALPPVRVRAAVSAVRRALCRAPLTSGFAGVLLGTTVALRKVVADQEAVLRWASTNVDNLAARPVRSVLVSALFLQDPIWLPYALALGATMLPLERRFGSLRTLAVFLSGHVLATALTEGGVAVGIRLGVLPAAEAGQLDVGVSYGIWASAGAALLLVPDRWRARVTAVTALGVLVPLLVEPDMTNTGHALCLAIGIGWWPVLRRLLAAPTPAFSAVGAAGR